MLFPQYDTLPFFQLGIYQLKYRRLLYLVISVQERRGRVPARLRCLLTKRPSFQKSGLLEKGTHHVPVLPAPFPPLLFGLFNEPFLQLLHNKQRVASPSGAEFSTRIKNRASFLHPVGNRSYSHPEYVRNLLARLVSFLVHRIQSSCFSASGGFRKTFVAFLPSTQFH